MAITKTNNRMIDGSVVNVLDYGASTTESAANNTTYIQNAIDDNKSIYIPEGTYNVTGVEVTGKTNFKIFGPGTLYLASVSNKPVLNIDNCSKFLIEGLRIDGNSAGQTETVTRNLGAGIKVNNSTDWKITRCIIENNYSGAGIVAIDNGLNSTELDTHAEVSFNILKNCGKVGGPLISDGMFINSDNTLVLGNIIDTTTDYGIAGDYSYKLIIKDNIIRNVDIIGIAVLGATDWQANGNIIDGAGGGIFVTLSGNPATAPFLTNGTQIHNNTIKNITRNPSGTPNGDGIFVDPSASDISIVGNQIRNVYRGIGCDSSNNVSIIANTIDTTIDRGLFASGAGSFISSNNITNAAGGAMYLGTTLSDKTIIERGVPDLVNVTSFLNNWSNFGSPDGDAGYYRQSGRVYLTGTVQGGTLTPGTPIFQLPAGYRPEYLVWFSVYDNAAFSVDTSGNVVIRSGSGSRFALDGISFIAHQ